MSKEKVVCPRCGWSIEDPQRMALSRVPQKGEPSEYVCSMCGVDEAIEQMNGSLVDWRSERKDQI